MIRHIVTCDRCGDTRDLGQYGDNPERTPPPGWLDLSGEKNLCHDCANARRKLLDDFMEKKA